MSTARSPRGRAHEDLPVLWRQVGHLRMRAHGFVGRVRTACRRAGCPPPTTPPWVRWLSSTRAGGQYARPPQRRHGFVGRVRRLLAGRMPATPPWVRWLSSPVPAGRMPAPNNAAMGSLVELTRAGGQDARPPNNAAMGLLVEFDACRRAGCPPPDAKITKRSAAG